MDEIAENKEVLFYDLGTNWNKTIGLICVF